ncbi:MAG: hypothetical protein ACFE0R_15950 [Salinarimonas sp.]
MAKDADSGRSLQAENLPITGATGLDESWIASATRRRGRRSTIVTSRLPVDAGPQLGS